MRGEIAELRMPEAEWQCGKLRGVTRGIGIVFHNFGGSRTNGDPVIELWRRFSHPPCAVVAEFDTADPRVVPEKAIPPTGEQEGNRDLGIALDQVNGAALLIQSSMLVLSEPVEPFIIVSTEAHLQVKEFAMHCFKGARRQTGGTDWRLLCQQLSIARRGRKTDAPLRGDAGANGAIANGGTLCPNGDLYLRLSRRKQDAHQVIANPCTDG